MDLNPPNPIDREELLAREDPYDDDVAERQRKMMPVRECWNDRCEGGRVAIWQNGTLGWRPCPVCKGDEHGPSN